MRLRNLTIITVIGLFVFGVLVGSAMAAKKNPLEAWKPKFDPSGAKYKVIVSNISHPVLKGVYTGYAIRDELWKRTNGQMYIDYKPLAQLGGEVEVLNQLQMGAIQGMGVSSVAAVNLGPRFGVVNLPFLINSFDKLDKFVASGKLFDHFMMAMDHQGIIGLDITGYGNNGWGTTIPVRSLADAKKVKFRVAEAAVNRLNSTTKPFETDSRARRCSRRPSRRRSRILERPSRIFEPMGLAIASRDFLKNPDEE